VWDAIPSVRVISVRKFLLGIVYALVAALGFSLVGSLAICLGLDPETRRVADTMAPLLGLFAGAGLAARDGSWRTGLAVGLLYVALWLLLWLYSMARWNPIEWLQLGFPRLTFSHLLWWCLSVIAAMAGARLRLRPVWFCATLTAAFALWIICADAYGHRCARLVPVPILGFNVERAAKAEDGTVVYSITMDSKSPSGLRLLPYDCDQDYEQPKRGEDANTTFLGQDLSVLVSKLNERSPDSPVICLINGGFFGESGWSVAHHEEPMVFGGQSYYPVDLLRPTDQGCFFVITNDQGRQRFAIESSITPEDVKKSEFVIGGVRPLLVDGKSLPLAPGAGGTGLRCSRTSIGWSADGSKFYVLVVKDPDGELASQIQRRMHWPQTGGWDVREVQQYWEQKDVPYAVLFDGGESTQLAILQPPGGYHLLDSGYQYSFTIGYLFQRPLVVTLPILPASEAHRGVLNYLSIRGG
jgi:hypothetical protein